MKTLKNFSNRLKVPGTSNEKTFLSVFVLLIALAFAAVSCAPPIEFSGYDWDAVNAGEDPTRTNGQGANVIGGPSASITEVDVSTTNSDLITAIYIDIEFAGTRADILRDAITQETLNFITFHTFTKAATDFTEDKFSDPIPFVFDKRLGDTIQVKLSPVSIDTSGDFSNILMRADAREYTYAHGLRLDHDQNGKIEDVYDDWYEKEIPFSAVGLTPTIVNYAGIGQQFTIGSVDRFISLPDVSAIIAQITSLGGSSTDPNVFYFSGSGETTNNNSWFFTLADTSGYSDKEKEFLKDMAEVLLPGIELQNLSGGTWTKVASPVYEVLSGTDSAGLAFKDFSFSHLVPYRVIWTGNAYTETTKNYYGVKQRVYVECGAGNFAEHLRKTEVFRDYATPHNNTLLKFFEINRDFTTSAVIQTFNVEGRNLVLTLKLEDIGNGQGPYFWNKVSLEDFKENFKIAYSVSGGYYVENPVTHASTFVAFDADTIFNASDLVYVDVENIRYGRDVPPGTTADGDNVLYITFDPNFRLPVKSGSAISQVANFNQVNAAQLAYQKYAIENAEYTAWYQQNEDFNNYSDAMNAYNSEHTQWITEHATWVTEHAQWETEHAAWLQWEIEYAQWEIDHAQWVDEGSTAGTEPVEPIEPANPQEPQEPIEPQVEDYLDYYFPRWTEYPDIGNTPPADPGVWTGNIPGTPPGVIQATYKRLFFRINEKIGVSDNQAIPDRIFFGKPDAIFQNFEFYGPL